MKDVLDAVQDAGTVLSDEVEDAFDPEQLVAAGADQHLPIHGEPVPVQRLVEGQAELVDAGVVPVGIVTAVPLRAVVVPALPVGVRMVKGLMS